VRDLSKNPENSVIEKINAAARLSWRSRPLIKHVSHACICPLQTV
jgi:hypothetical protein